MQINANAVEGQSHNVGELMAGAKKVLSGLVLTAGSTIGPLGVATAAVGLAGGAACVIGELVGVPAKFAFAPEMANHLSQHLEAIGGYGAVALGVGAFSTFVSGVLTSVSEHLDKRYESDVVDHGFTNFKAAKQNIMEGIRQMRENAFGNSENKNSNKIS